VLGCNTGDNAVQLLGLLHIHLAIMQAATKMGASILSIIEGLGRSFSPVKAVYITTCLYQSLGEC